MKTHDRDKRKYLQRLQIEKGYHFQTSSERFWLEWSPAVQVSSEVEELFGELFRSRKLVRCNSTGIPTAHFLRDFTSTSTWLDRDLYQDTLETMDLTDDGEITSTDLIEVVQRRDALEKQVCRFAESCTDVLDDLARVMKVLLCEARTEVDHEHQLLTAAEAAWDMIVNGAPVFDRSPATDWLGRFLFDHGKCTEVASTAETGIRYYLQDRNQLLEEASQFDRRRLVYEWMVYYGQLGRPLLDADQLDQRVREVRDARFKWKRYEDWVYDKARELLDDNPEIGTMDLVEAVQEAFLDEFGEETDYEEPSTSWVYNRVRSLKE
jgi:hypothetical protein